jgi:dihydrofolate reductase
MSNDEDMSCWVQNGSGINQYFTDLQSFDTVIMGRKTYEFGYKFGLKSGQVAYTNMKNYVFSNTLQITDIDERLKICPIDLQIIKDIKNQIGTDIYLCGGGEMAGWLLTHQQIDILKIKLNPLLLGNGVRLFGRYMQKYATELITSKLYDNGLQILEYKIVY